MPTLTPAVSKDTYLNDGAATTNYGTDTTFKVGSDVGRSTTIYRALMDWDISAIPQKSRIRSVSLAFTTSGGNTDGNSQVYAFHRVDSDASAWVEAEATQGIYKSGSNWKAAGGDYDAALTKTFQVIGPEAVSTWSFTDNTADGVFRQIVHDAVRRRKGDLNLLMKQHTEGSTDAAMTWASQNHGTSGKRPVLTIVYTAWSTGTRSRQGMRRSSRGFGC